MINGPHRRVRRPSPALVVASLALLVALSGTSFAASIELAKNSVGTVHLKKNAVTSAKIANGAVTSSDVKDGSLVRADFARGQIPAGAPGPIGPPGPAGPAGPAGAAGPPGPSETYVLSRNGVFGVPRRSEATLASLTIPVAGAYLVIAKAGVSGNGTVTCRLEAGSDFDLSQATPAASSNQTLTNIVGHGFTSAGSVNLKCLGDEDAAVNTIRIAATRVGQLVSTT